MQFLISHFVVSNSMIIKRNKSSQILQFMIFSPKINTSAIQKKQFLRFSKPQFKTAIQNQQFKTNNSLNSFLFIFTHDEKCRLPDLHRDNSDKNLFLTCIISNQFSYNFHLCFRSGAWQIHYYMRIVKIPTLNFVPSNNQFRLHQNESPGIL